MRIKMGGGWSAGTSDGTGGQVRTLYAQDARWRKKERLTLEQALSAGMLDAVMRARGLTRSQLAQAIGVTTNAVNRWARAEQFPTKGLYREALVSWLLAL